LFVLCSLCCQFLWIFFLFVLCSLCCQFLWIVFFFVLCSLWQSRETGNIGYTRRTKRQSRETGNIGYTRRTKRQSRETGNIAYRSVSIIFVYCFLCCVCANVTSDSGLSILMSCVPMFTSTINKNDRHGHGPLQNRGL
jgi:hypothetical protein